ncbi:nephrocystin-3 isoform X1 [Punica granatum]|uniref:Nephrocystin-3 isoform X1 n=1 Tax=Punica granatum TaxID=22663 RepID=A0A6P8DBW1_PUNGR|nr:nephrocystin-3 isoform X1 [Punica granatum]
MATSPLQPPLTIHKFRTTIQFFPSFSSTHFPRSVFDAKVLAVRTKVACRPGTIKAFAAVRSAETGVVHRRENGSRTSQSFEKSGTLLDDLAEPLDAGSGFERDLQGLFDEVKRMIASGKENDAVDLLQANFQAVKVQMEDGAKGIEEVATLDIIALGYMALGDLKAVALILEKMNEVAGSLRDDENLLGSVVMHMGSMYSALGKFEKSVLMYQRAVGILEGIYGKDSTFLVTPLLGMAKALGCIGRATKATRTYQHAVAILESSRGVESEDLVVPLLALGNLLIKEGKANDAEYQFTRVVSIYTKLYGENDGRVGIALSSLAHVKCAKVFTGDVEEAIYAYRKALQIMKDSNYVALDDSVMERMRIDLAELLHVVGRGDEGRQLLEECLLITEEQKGKDHPSFVNHLVNLATSYSRSKNYAEAERLLRAALGIMTRTLGPDDQSISFPMLHLAVALYNLKRDEEAEQLAVDVIRIREKAFGEDSLPVGEALDCLVSIRARLGKQDGDLVALLKRVLRIQEEGFGYESEEVMVTLKKILFYLDKLGRKDEKFGLQKRLSVLKERYKHMIQY